MFSYIHEVQTTGNDIVHETNESRDKEEYWTLNDKLPNQTSPQPFISLSHIVIISGINLTGCTLFLTVAAIMVWDEIVCGNTNKVLFVTLPIHLISDLIVHLTSPVSVLF